MYRLTGYRFCTKALRQKSEDVDYHSLNFKMIYHFLDWNLNQRTGKNGRSKRGLKSKSSLVTFWCIFRLAFERATTFKIDELIDRRRLSNVRISLVTYTTSSLDYKLYCLSHLMSLPLRCTPRHWLKDQAISGTTFAASNILESEAIRIHYPYQRPTI